MHWLGVFLKIFPDVYMHYFYVLVCWDIQRCVAIQYKEHLLVFTFLIPLVVGGGIWRKWFV